MKIKINKNLRRHITESDVKKVLEITRPRKLRNGKMVVVEIGRKIRVVNKNDSDTWVVMTHEDYNTFIENF